MADSSVAVTPGSGANVDTRTTAGGDHRQVQVIGNDGDTIAAVSPFGALRTQDEGTTLLYDSHDAALDTTNTWNNQTTTNGSVTVSNSKATFGAGSGFSSGIGAISSKASFNAFVPAFLQVSMAIQLESGADGSALTTATGKRFWGLGSAPGSPTESTSITDGVGFEVDGSGKLYAVAYASGVRTSAVDLTTSGTGLAAGKMPYDGLPHRYIMQYRTDRVFFFIDSLTGDPVATLSFPSMNAQVLPVRVAWVPREIGGQASGATFISWGIAVADLGRNAQGIADSTFPWRKATVRSDGALNVNLSGSAGVQTTASGQVTANAASNTTGTASTSGTVVADVSSAGNATIVLYGGTYSSLTLAFEACPDSTGTNWFPIDATRPDGSGVDVQPSFTAAGVRAWNIICPGYKYVRVRVVLLVSTTGPTVAIVPGPFLYDPSPTISPVDGQKTTYSAAFDAIATTIASDLFVVTGSSTKTVRILRIALSGIATAAAALRLLALKRSSGTAYAGGTSTSATLVPHDSTNAAATVTVKSYTVAATTIPTVVGNIRAGRLNQSTAATNVQPLEWVFGSRPGQGVVLRGNTEHLAINAPAAPGSGSALSFEVEWTEE